MKKENKRTIFGIAWYSKKAWKQLKLCADDSEELNDTYEEWLQTVKKLEMDLIINGYITERIDVDIKALIKWCKENNVANTKEARSEYVAMLLKNKTV